MVRTVNDAYLDLRNELRQHGVAGYQLEAKELIAHALGIGRDQIPMRGGQYLFDGQIDQIARLRDARLAGTPLQYLLGEWEFYGLTFNVTQDTLIPRPDTELLVDRALAFLQGMDQGRVLDLCCGTGCIGISILKYTAPGIRGVLADCSEPALKVARGNLYRHGLSSRCFTVQLDALKPYDRASGQFQLITCNPPYIRSDEMDRLDPEVKCEPALALCGGEDGLDFYRAVASHYRKALTPGGALLFEVGLGQAADVLALMESNGFERVNAERDLAGIERLVWGVWNLGTSW